MFYGPVFKTSTIIRRSGLVRGIAPSVVSQTGGIGLQNDLFWTGNSGHLNQQKHVFTWGFRQNVVVCCHVLLCAVRCCHVLLCAVRCCCVLLCVVVCRCVLLCVVVCRCFNGMLCCAMLCCVMCWCVVLMLCCVMMCCVMMCCVNHRQY